MSCTHPEPTAGGFCPDCERQTILVRLGASGNQARLNNGCICDSGCDSCDRLAESWEAMKSALELWVRSEGEGLNTLEFIGLRHEFALKAHAALYAVNRMETRR